MGRGIGTATRMAPVWHGDGDNDESPPLRARRMR